MYMNEDIAWQRMLDLQREMDNSRLLAYQGVPALARVAELLGGPILRLVASLRPVRREERMIEDSQSATDAA